MLTSCQFDFTFIQIDYNAGQHRRLFEGGQPMAVYLYLATAAGLFIIAQTNGNWNIVHQTLKEHSLTSIAVSDSTIIAGTREGIWHSGDKGQTWQKAKQDLANLHVRWMKASPKAPGIFLAGTEPADILVSSDGAKTWQISPEVGQLRDAFGWFLPYSPEAGCVRGFAVAASGPQAGRIYAAVEVGGVLVSDDNGKNWHLPEGSDGSPDIHRELGTLIHPDVHSITVHPASSDLVTAATGGGLYRSVDGGNSWKILYRCYIRAVWVDPGDPQHIVAGPADGVSRNGRIEASYDGGKTWQPASEGLKAPWSRYMVERFVHFDKDLFAVLSNGELWLRRQDEPKWQQILPEIASVKAIAASH
jgi:photosystem II stability/assembly factor-like uncharacterized protein